MQLVNLFKSAVPSANSTSDIPKKLDESTGELPTDELETFEATFALSPPKQLVEQTSSPNLGEDLKLDAVDTDPDLTTETKDVENFENETLGNSKELILREPSSPTEVGLRQTSRTNDTDITIHVTQTHAHKPLIQPLIATLSAEEQAELMLSANSKLAAVADSTQSPEIEWQSTPTQPQLLTTVDKKVDELGAVLSKLDAAPKLKEGKVDTHLLGRDISGWKQTTFANTSFNSIDDKNVAIDPKGISLDQQRENNNKSLPGLLVSRVRSENPEIQPVETRAATLSEGKNFNIPASDIRKMATEASDASRVNEDIQNTVKSRQPLEVVNHTANTPATPPLNLVGVAKTVVPNQVALGEEDKAVKEVDAEADLSQLDNRRSAQVSSTSSMPRADLPRHVAAQIFEALRQSPDRPVEISLNPDELGRVRLTIVTIDGTVTLNVLAERQETVDLMRRNADALARELADLGFESIDLAFGQGQQTDDPSRERDPQSNQHIELVAHDEIDNSNSESAASMGLDSSRALDIRI